MNNEWAWSGGNAQYVRWAEQIDQQSSSPAATRDAAVSGNGSSTGSLRQACDRVCKAMDAAPRVGNFSNSSWRHRGYENIPYPGRSRGLRTLTTRRRDPLDDLRSAGGSTPSSAFLPLSPAGAPAVGRCRAWGARLGWVPVVQRPLLRPANRAAAVARHGDLPHDAGEPLHWHPLQPRPDGDGVAGSLRRRDAGFPPLVCEPTAGINKEGAHLARI